MTENQQVAMRKIVGYLGPQGTYSEEMALSLYEAGKVIADFMPYASIDAVIRAVETGEVTEGVVPIENSLEGSVNITLDVLAHEVDLFITREMIKPIKHHLLVHENYDQSMPIAAIVSHYQALAQCRSYIAAFHPGVDLKVVDSTAAAARLVAEGEPGYAAIGSMRAGQLHGLKVAAADIQDQNNNCTRFIVLKRQPEVKTGECRKTSVVCKINGERPGSLCDFLLEFAKREVNLTKIESRPARTGLGEYIFFFDIEGSDAEEKVSAAIKAIETKSLWFKNLGSYSCYKG